MDKGFFEHENYIEFLNYRYNHLKATKPHFSTRYFAKQSGVKSPSYLGLVLNGKRKLSVDYAKKFAKGLHLSTFHTDCIVSAVALENTKEQKKRIELQEAIARLKWRESERKKIDHDHIEVLADLLNLKLYLLAQSECFQYKVSWVSKQFGEQIPLEIIESRMNLLIESGLWKPEGESVKICAPSLVTGDVESLGLVKSHENSLEASKRSLNHEPYENRITEGLTILFDPNNMPELREKIKTFKADVEMDLEKTASTRVYQMHINFFELKDKVIL